MSHRLKVLQQTEPEVTEEELSEIEVQQEESEVPEVEVEVTTESLLSDQLSAIKELKNLQSDICEQNENIISIMKDIKKIDLAILKEQRDGADEGGRMQIHGKARDDKFFIVDTQKDPGHKIKAFVLRNDGPEDISIAYNAAISSVGPSIEDVKKSLIFEKLERNEDKKYAFNRNVIKNIYILADKGESHFRVNLAW
jgi:hypothetical protein